MAGRNGGGLRAVTGALKVGKFVNETAFAQDPRSPGAEQVSCTIAETGRTPSGAGHLVSQTHSTYLQR